MKKKKTQVSDEVVDSVVTSAACRAGGYFPMTPDEVARSEAEELSELPPSLRDSDILFRERRPLGSKHSPVPPDIAENLGLAARHGTTLSEAARKLMDDDRAAAEAEVDGKF